MEKKKQDLQFHTMYENKFYESEVFKCKTTNWQVKYDIAQGSQKLSIQILAHSPKSSNPDTHHIYMYENQDSEK